MQSCVRRTYVVRCLSLSVCLSVSVSLSLYVSVFVSLSLSPSPLPPSLSPSLLLFLSVSLSVCLSLLRSLSLSLSAPLSLPPLSLSLPPSFSLSVSLISLHSNRSHPGRPSCIHWLSSMFLVFMMQRCVKLLAAGGPGGLSSASGIYCSIVGKHSDTIQQYFIDP